MILKGFSTDRGIGYVTFYSGKSVAMRRSTQLLLGRSATSKFGITFSRPSCSTFQRRYKVHTIRIRLISLTRTQPPLQRTTIPCSPISHPQLRNSTSKLVQSTGTFVFELAYTPNVTKISSITTTFKFSVPVRLAWILPSSFSTKPGKVGELG